MTAKQRIALIVAAVALLAIVVLLVWHFGKPEDTPDGILVYREAYMRIADQPWQGEQLCRSR